MNLILPDEKPCTALFPQRGCRNNTWPKSPECYECVAMKEWQMRQEAYKAQARHMAREIVALRSDYDRLSALAFKDKYGFKEVHNFEKSLFAWLRQEGVM